MFKVLTLLFSAHFILSDIGLRLVHHPLSMNYVLIGLVYLKKKVFYYLHFIFVFFQRQRILDLVYFQTRLTLYAFSMNWGPFFVCMHFYVYMIEILAVV